MWLLIAEERRAEEAAKVAMADPEVVAILQVVLCDNCVIDDPEVVAILQRYCCVISA